MKSVLGQAEVKQVEDSIESFEANTRCELLMVIAESSDSYPGASWRFGVLGGFLLSLTVAHYFELGYTILWPVLFFTLTLLMTWVGHYDWAKRMTLSQWEVDQQCDQRAIECFHAMGTSQVEHKVTAMIMISVLERNIEVLIDEKLKEKIDQADLNELISIMQVHFKENHMAQGLLESIQSLELKILKKFGGPVSDANPNELDNTIHFI